MITVLLRPLKDDDLPRIYRWISDPEVTQFTTIGTFPLTLDKLREIVHRRDASSRHATFAITFDKEAWHIGVIALNSIDWVNRMAEVELLIGEKRYWSKGYGTEAIKLIAQYAFNRLGLHKLWAGVYAENIAIQKTLTKAGFMPEAILKNELFLNSRWQDRVYFSILKEGG